jgi:glycosyltransferase involved in cell wall biosynthesis
MPDLHRLSIVIPLAAGETAWRGLLPSLREQAASAEIVLSVVADDPQPFPGGVRVIRGAAGRARQLNAGAAIASREWLWLLHADSRLGNGTVAAIERAPGTDYLGFFDLAFHDGGWLVRLNMIGAWLRSRLLRLPFGDQGFLLRRDLFESLDRFDESLDSGEDHALVWAARHKGVALRALRARLYSSARKYATNGWWATTRGHAVATLTQARRFSQAKP